MICQVVFYWTLLARHISHYFDAKPDLKPAVIAREGSIQQVNLSAQQEEQIKEIFDLFDTDGGGTIDRGEMDFALVALGFNAPKSNKNNGALVDEIVQDGVVTLEEFSALMMGELSGRDPQEMLRAVFAVLSQPEGVHDTSGLITYTKLHAVCSKFKVGLRFHT